MGRPNPRRQRTDPRDDRLHTLQIRMNSREVRELDDLCQREDTNRSDFVRHLIHEAYTHHHLQPPRFDPRLDT